ncbi:MAG: hypothetical protein HKN48_12825, partial [Flavobacteriaceae bacterium]|nr:hypothetical protein [Flavobacteriaceae bacterium]
FNEAESLCGCAEMISDCTLWSEINRRLKSEFPGYDALEFQQKVKEIQYYKNFQNLPKLLDTEEWGEFREVVSFFYRSISEVTGKQTIIDSSKSIPWAYMLTQIPTIDLRIIHLERDLLSVANSWKKKVPLPEYPNREVWMPVKSNWVIAKNWLKIKKMARILEKRANYMFLSYEDFCSHPEQKMSEIEQFANVIIPANELELRPNHAIGGNPMRSSLNKIEIHKGLKNHKNLNSAAKTFFKLTKRVSKII